MVSFPLSVSVVDFSHDPVPPVAGCGTDRPWIQHGAPLVLLFHDHLAGESVI